MARLDTGYQSTSAMLASAAALVGADGQIDRRRLETFADLLIAGSPVNAVTYGPIVQALVKNLARVAARQS